jgi:hypothetical protein
VRDSAEPALELVPFTRELNREILRITGLDPGPYVIRIDGIPVAIHESSELAAGINLATNTRTPMYEQALRVAAANDKRHALEGGPIRSVALAQLMASRTPGLDLADVDAVTKALLDRVERFKGKRLYNYFKHHATTYIKHKPRETEMRQEHEQAMSEVWKVNRPVPHAFAVTPASPADAADIPGGSSKCR